MNLNKMLLAFSISIVNSAPDNNCTPEQIETLVKLYDELGSCIPPAPLADEDPECTEERKKTKSELEACGYDIKKHDDEMYQKELKNAGATTLTILICGFITGCVAWKCPGNNNN